MATQRSAESAVWFRAYDVTSATYVYGSAGETDSVTGRVLTRPYARKTVAIQVMTLLATTLSVQIEAQVAEFPGFWFPIWNKTFTAAGTQVWYSEMPFDFLRVGAKVFGAAGNILTVAGAFRGH